MLEFDDVSGREKFTPYLEDGEREGFLELLYRAAAFVDAAAHIKASRDPSDDKFLEVAVAGQAKVIVSGDYDLLGLDPFRGIRIVKARTFLEEYPRASRSG